MKLPILPFLGKKEASNHYLALLLRDEKASAVIFKEENGKITVVGKNEEYFPTSVDHADTEEILDTLDRTISRAEETLPQNIETEKTIFGLKETWVEDGKITKDYLAKLKKVSDELKLSPVGFLVISEAITKLIEEEEGAPLSAIITEIGKNNVTLTLFKAGRNVESHSSHIEESIPKTVDSLLKTFTSVEVLPSRLIIFDGENGEKIAQEFITHQWSRGLSFLHMPQVSVVPMGFDGRAVVFGAALQMGFEVSGSIIDSASSDIKTLGAEGSSSEEQHTRREKAVKMEEEDVAPNGDNGEVGNKAAEAVNEDFPTSGDNFGFVMGQDVSVAVAPDVEQAAKNDEIKSAPLIKRNEGSVHTAAHDFHFATEHLDVENEISPVKATEEAEKVGFSQESRQSNDQKLAFLGTFTGMMSRLKSIPGPMNLLSGLRSGSKLLIIPPILILLLIGAVLFYIFKLEATVTVHVSPKTQEESQDITFSAKEENDFGNSVIQAKAVSTTIDGEDSIETTGKKETGEKAKGSVTLYNDSDGKKTFTSGTTITSSNDLVYVLDKDVAIASRSGDVFSGTKPGTAQVAVTAKTLGTEYNLPSNTKFKVDGASSSYAAKNDTAFSGGTKKEIRVVSKKDVEKLSANLPKSLVEKAKNDLNAEIAKDETLLPEFTDITLSKKTLSKKEGEEAKTLLLNASVTFEGLTYSNQDVITYAKLLLKDKVSDDQALSDESLSVEVVDIEEISEDEVKAKLKIEAGILPKLDTKMIIVELTGKSFRDAEDYLSKLPQVAKSEVTLTPNIPFLPQILPRIGKNIKVVVDTDE